MKTYQFFNISFFLLFLLVITTQLLAQIADDTTVYVVAEQNPEFPGGQKAMLKYIITNTRIPDSALSNNVHGTVYIRAVVEPDSTLTHVSVLRGLGYGCDEEALRVVASMPKWKPGVINGKKIRVTTNIPVYFTSKQNKTEQIYTKVDSLPILGTNNFSFPVYFKDHLLYPVDIIDNKIIDTVDVLFVVEKDKSISNVRLMHPKDSLSPYDYEAMRVISKIPVSAPAILNNRSVRMNLFIPVIFNYKNVDTTISTIVKHTYNENIFSYYKPASPMVNPENMPEFPGGRHALMTYIASNLKYPPDARKKLMSGTVFVQFFIEKDGSVSHAKVIEGVCPSINTEALRVINSMPKWKPGIENGKPVRVQFTLPIKFSIRIGK